jgi:hypothetical protein
MSRPKLMAVFAALTTAGAAAVPVATASAQAGPARYSAPTSLCVRLHKQSNGALANGNPTLAPLLVDTAGYIGCRAAAR